MHHDIRVLFTAPITLAGLLALAGCDAEPPVDNHGALEAIDLTRFGVEDIVADADGYELRDADGAPIGHVAVDGGDAGAEFDVTLRDSAAEVDWDDAQASMRCDAGAPMTVRAGEAGWSAPVQAGGDDLHACDDALEVGFLVARAAGLTPPWAAELEDPVAFRFGGCMTVSTWVGGSSCWSCAQAAGEGRCSGCYETGGSCSSGTLYTTCSHTFCQTDAPMAESAQ